MKRSIWFVINPISGVRRKEDIPQLIHENLDHSKFDYLIKTTSLKGHAIEISKEAVVNNIDIVCAVGGDGSAHEVGISLIGSKTKLAIIPIGSGNGIARHMKIPLKISEAILCINNSSEILMDTVLVDENPFLGFGGYGIDALIAKRFNEDKKRGFWTYVKHVFIEFFRFNPINVTIDTNGQIKKMPVIMCTIANTSEFGNGFVFSPKSDATDGKIELILLKPFSNWYIPMLIFQFFMNRVDRSKFTEVISFKSAKITISQKMAHYDGEPTKISGELNVKVVPKSLHILIGKK